jgi:hypothetical protein
MDHGPERKLLPRQHVGEALHDLQALRGIEFVRQFGDDAGLGTAAFAG